MLFLRQRNFAVAVKPHERAKRIGSGLIAVLVTFALEAAEPDTWPSWRGPTGQGHAPSTKLPKFLPPSPPRPTWEYTLGAGWSSPVTDGRVVIGTDRNGNVERVVGLRFDNGQELWTRSNPVAFDPHPVGRRHGNGPKSTPAIAAGKVVTLGIAGWLQALNVTDGQIVWQHHLPAEFGRAEPLAGQAARVVGEEHVLVPIGGGQGAPVPLFGYTGSPLIVDQRVIVSVGGLRGGTLMAFDLTTGREVWRALRENVSYSSSVLCEIGGQRQLVAMTGPRVVGVNPTDGSLLWSEPFQIQYDESISTPVVADSLVIVNATGRPLTAWRIERTPTGWRSQFAWDNFDAGSYLSSNVVHNGHWYGMNDGGEFHCVRLADGKTMWSGGRHGYYSSPLLVGDRLWALNERGRLLVLAATPAEYRELGSFQLSAGESWTAPAVVGNRLFVRSANALRCYDFTGQ